MGHYPIHVLLACMQNFDLFGKLFLMPGRETIPYSNFGVGSHVIGMPLPEIKLDIFSFIFNFEGWVSIYVIVLPCVLDTGSQLITNSQLIL